LFGGGRSRSRTGLHCQIPCEQGKEQGISVLWRKRPKGVCAIIPGNFAKSRLLARQRLQIVAAVTGLSTQIPYTTEQGIISAEQGILAQEQGIFSDKTENITNEVFGTHN
jgi:hypothetical protein